MAKKKASRKDLVQGAEFLSQAKPYRSRIQKKNTKKDPTAKLCQIYHFSIYFANFKLVGTRTVVGTISSTAEDLCQKSRKLDTGLATVPWGQW